MVDYKVMSMENLMRIEGKKNNVNSIVVKIIDYSITFFYMGLLL